MKFLGAFITTFLAIAFELRLKHLFGFSPDLALATLLILGSFVSLGELMILILSSVFILNWQPALSWEIIWFSLLPLAFAAIHRIFPFESWTANLISVGLGTLLFTLFVDPRFVVRDIVGFAELWLGAIVCGMAIYYFFETTFTKRRRMII